MNRWNRAVAALLTAMMLSIPAVAAAPASPAICAFNEASYQDVLSTLSASEKDRLFQRLLCNITTSYFDQSGVYDVRSSSEESILNCLQWLQIGTHFPLQEYGLVENSRDYLHPYRFSKADFDRLTSELFGQNLSFDGRVVTSIPNENNVKEAYRTYLYNGDVHLFMPQAGDVMNERAEPHHLYQLKGNLYCASFTMYEWYLDEVNNQSKEGDYQAIVQRNSNGSWTLLYLSKKGGTIDDATLSAFQTTYNQPSDWAKAEVAAAQAAGLGQNLSGDPGWQDQATRLHFAQLAVQFVEAATGKSLDAAPASTFGDCADPAVLKAYQAGIVNGTGSGAFTPNGTLDRETLSTMLWRAVEYVQAQNGRTVLTSGSGLSGYSDAKDVSSWALEAVTALNTNEILKGQSATTLAPKGACSVEQSLVLAYRTLQKLT